MAGFAATSSSLCEVVESQLLAGHTSTTISLSSSLWAASSLGSISSSCCGTMRLVDTNDDDDDFSTT